MDWQYSPPKNQVLMQYLKDHNLLLNQLIHILYGCSLLNWLIEINAKWTYAILWLLQTDTKHILSSIVIALTPYSERIKSEENNTSTGTTVELFWINLLLNKILILMLLQSSLIGLSVLRIQYSIATYIVLVVPAEHLRVNY